VEGLGPRTLQSLALIAEVTHGAPSQFSDPARFSFVHVGKDGHPFPVLFKTYDESLRQITLNARRSVELKQIFYQELQHHLHRGVKLRKEDVLIEACGRTAGRQHRLRTCKSSAGWAGFFLFGPRLLALAEMGQVACW